MATILFKDKYGNVHQTPMMSYDVACRLARRLPRFDPDKFVTVWEGNDSRSYILNVCTNRVYAEPWRRQ
jgi:hypothetical protein